MLSRIPIGTGNDAKPPDSGGFSFVGKRHHAGLSGIPLLDDARPWGNLRKGGPGA
jgi:hypothetical protein